MIKSFTHKGLETFFKTGSTKGIQAKHKNKLRLQLAMLEVSAQAQAQAQDMDKPGWFLHKLKGDKTNIWSVKVSGNWRMTFGFEDGHAYIVNYEDYH